MTWRKSLTAWAVVLLALASACNMPRVTDLLNVTLEDPISSGKTQVAQIEAATAAVETILANIVESTLSSMKTSTPEFTFTLSPSLETAASSTATLTQTPTFTPSSTYPTVKVTLETNCRSGPGGVYDILGIFRVGETGEVIGRNSFNDTWIVKLPSNPAIHCWLWGYYAKVSGDWEALPVIAPPPTPTPSGGFTVEYEKFGVGAGYSCMIFMVTNSGAIPWNSYSLNVNDSAQGVNGANTSNDFNNYDPWCILTGGAPRLMPGETGRVSAKLALYANPSGNHLNITLNMCSGNDLGGACISQTVNGMVVP